jgi:hypothetical protein
MPKLTPSKGSGCLCDYAAGRSVLPTVHPYRRGQRSRAQLSLKGPCGPCTTLAFTNSSWSVSPSWLAMVKAPQEFDKPAASVRPYTDQGEMSVGQ